MKRLLLAVTLLIASTSIFADVGLFFDGTNKYAKTGIIKKSFPNVQLVSCPSFKSCESFLQGHKNIGIIFSDIAKMKAEARKRTNKDIESAPIRTVSYKGFKLFVTDLISSNKRILMIAIKTGKNADKAKNKSIAKALVAEITYAYSRLPVVQF